MASPLQKLHFGVCLCVTKPIAFSGTFEQAQMRLDCYQVSNSGLLPNSGSSFHNDIFTLYDLACRKTLAEKLKTWMRVSQNRAQLGMIIAAGKVQC